MSGENINFDGEKIKKSSFYKNKTLFNKNDIDVSTILTSKKEPYHCFKSVQLWRFFWSMFSRIWTKYGEIRSISPYSVRMRENTDQKKLRIWTLFLQCMVKKAHSNTLLDILMMMMSLDHYV